MLHVCFVQRGEFLGFTAARKCSDPDTPNKPTTTDKTATDKTATDKATADNTAHIPQCGSPAHQLIS